MSDEGFPVLPVRLSREGMTVYPTPADFTSSQYREPQVVSESFGLPTETADGRFIVPVTIQMTASEIATAEAEGRRILRRYTEMLADLPVYDWPRRGFPEDQVATVLAFVARGGFDWQSLMNRIWSLFPDRDGWWSEQARTMADRTIRRAKREKRIAWSPHDQCYVALPAWRHKPIHDRRGWNWPNP